MFWEQNDLSKYNTAPSPWYSVHPNGKVDIGIETGGDRKISLQPWGMYKLVKEWLKVNKLEERERQELIGLLTK